MAQISFTGRAGKDPVLTFTADGKAMLRVSVAEGHREKNRDTGQWEDAGTTWLTCVARDGLAENIVTKFTKGQKIFVKGQLKQREYEKDGAKRKSMDVRVTDVALQGSVTPSPSPSAPPRSAPAPKTGSGFDDMADDIPF